jgi:hypothetical protein
MNKIAIAALAAFLTLAPAYAQTAQTDTPAAATQNTITTTAPVTSSTSISVGTIAGEVLTWAATAFGSVGAMVGTAFLIRLFKKAGLEGADLMSDQINKTLLNGLNDAAARITTATAGKGVVDIKNQIIESAIEYAQAHRAETIHALGLDPTSGKAVQALRARIATLVADPSVPTPPVLGGPAA